MCYTFLNMEQQLAVLYEAAWQRATKEEQQALAAAAGVDDRAEPKAVFTAIARQARRLDPWTASRGVEGWDQNITRPRACRSLPCRPAPRPACGSPRPSVNAAGCRRSRHTRTPPP